MTMSSYSLNCSVCQGVYFSKSDWLDHLTTPRHLIFSRHDIVDESNLDRNGIKDCSLLVFSNTPLTLSSGGGAEKLVRYFSRDPTTFVTDFVWWGDRPRFGILQFESRKKALETQGGSTRFFIDGTETEVKWAGQLSKLEWRAYLPECDTIASGPPKIKTLAANNGKEKENCKPKLTWATSASADSSLIPDDNLDQDNQVAEISSSDKPKATNSKPKNAIRSLERFVNRQGWSKPEFVFRRLKKSRHLCSIIINGEEYKPSARVAGGESEMDAKLKAAMFTLEKLRLSTAPKKMKENSAGAGRTASVEVDDQPSPTKNEMRTPKRLLESDDNTQEEKIEGQPSKKLKTNGTGGTNAISLLVELAQRNKWPVPVFKCQKEKKGTGNAPMFSYSVKVNGVMYKPDSSIPKVETMKQAKGLIAEFCLKTLTSSMTSQDSETVEKSTAVTDLKLPFQDTPIPLPDPNFSPVPASLKYELECVKNTVTISVAEFRAALDATDALRKLFRTDDPAAEVVMFRNWHLKLRNPNHSENHELLVYVYSPRSRSEFPQSFSWFPYFVVLRLLNKIESRERFELLEAVDNSSEVDKFNQPIGWKLQFKPNNLTFCLVTYPRFFVESQMSRLTDYMCTFDPRCHPLLTLVYYWTTNNCVTIGDYTTSTGKNTSWSLPEPYSLEWLVIVFLCQRGIIPTPREIQERRHEILKDRLYGIDVGFDEDPEFVKEWKSKRNINSDQTQRMNEIELLQQFLHFYGETLSNGNWIINTRDGEVLPMSSVLNCEPNQESLSSLQTKMSLEELMELRSLHHREPKLSTEETSTAPELGPKPYNVYFYAWKLYMVHPFKFSCRFSMTKNMKTTLNLMKSTGSKLKTYLNMRKSNGVKAAKKRFGSLEKVLKVVDE